MDYFGQLPLFSASTYAFPLAVSVSLSLTWPKTHVHLFDIDYLIFTLIGFIGWTIFNLSFEITKEAKIKSNEMIQEVY